MNWLSVSRSQNTPRWPASTMASEYLNPSTEAAGLPIRLWSGGPLLVPSPTTWQEAHRNSRSESGMRQAIEHFHEATALDAGLAVAHSGLADCYVTLGKASHMPPAEAFPAARRHAIKALQLDPGMAEARASLGFVKLYFDWDWPGAEAEFQQAIAADLHYSVSHE